MGDRLQSGPGIKVFETIHIGVLPLSQSSYEPEIIYGKKNQTIKRGDTSCSPVWE